ncbi:MAG: hypothetical protein PHI48_09235 [Bacteroidales bacterium]|nr:hypothetical protein [Bacteroidales bacterium]MDD4822724.1 hypothetical protein [Bacteroidales bacterium]
MKKRIACVLLCVLFTNVLFAQKPLWQGKGRIVISSDGNVHDEDDWAASPVMLALLAAKGMQDKLALYTYCDHIWEGRSDRAGFNGYDEMQESVLKGKELFQFSKTRFVCAVDNPEKAYDAMCAEINKSSKKNPLVIIAAGPMQVIGEGISRAKKEKRQYVTLITHGVWNNVHSGKDSEKYKNPHEGWSYEDIMKAFSSDEGGRLTCIHISDQNGRERDANGKQRFEGLYVNKSRFSWLLTSEARNQPPYTKGSWEWLHSRLERCDKDQHRNFDASDAGMLLYVLTGSDKTSPDMIREIMEHPSKK